MVRVERNGARDVLHLIAKAVDALDERAGFPVRWRGLGHDGVLLSCRVVCTAREGRRPLCSMDAALIDPSARSPLTHEFVLLVLTLTANQQTSDAAAQTRLTRQHCRSDGNGRATFRFAMLRAS